MELSDEQLAHFQWAFSLLNEDKDGNITITQLNALAMKLGKTVTEAHLNALVNEVDIDGNGYIEFKEFCDALTMRLSGDPDEDELREAFRILDKDGTGFVGPDQLRTIFNQLDYSVTDEEIEEMIQAADWDSDGRISYEEFLQMMSNK